MAHPLYIHYINLEGSVLHIHIKVGVWPTTTASTELRVELNVLSTALVQ
jgi:hypothetical protein